MSSGTFRSIVPQFTVPDVVRTAEYYRDVWGFRIAGYWQDPPVFAIVERDGVELFFNQARPGTTPRTGRVAGGYDVYLHVRGLDAFATDLAERGAEILEGPVLREYGQRELVVRDCNGLVLALGEESASAAAAATESPEYRIGTATDASCISVLAMQVFLDTYATEGIRPDLAREVLSGYSVEAFSARLSAQATKFILAERRAHLLGFAEVTSNRPCPSAADVGGVELVRLYVQRRSQRQGIGRELLRRAELEAARSGGACLWLAVWSANDDAIAFYHMLGYRTVTTAEHVFEDRAYETMILAKRLITGA